MDRRVEPRGAGRAAAFRAVAAVVLAISLWLPVAAEGRDGDVVRVEGQVLDQNGTPVSGVKVLLEATRTSFSWLKRKKTSEPPLQQLADVDDEGRFVIPWSRHRHYNEFSLAVAVDVTRGGKPDFEILHRQDLTKAMNGEVPVNVFITLEKAGYVRWLQTYLEDRASEDEEQVFRENGRPDRIKTEDRESSWWYFSAGKVIRFRDGKLDQVIHFDPVESAPPSSTP